MEEAAVELDAKGKKRSCSAEITREGIIGRETI